MCQAVQSADTEIAQRFGGGGFGDNLEFGEEFVGTASCTDTAMLEAHAVVLGVRDWGLILRLVYQAIQGIDAKIV